MARLCALLLALFFCGCLKPIERSVSAKILIKTKDFKFFDYGIIQNSKSGVKLVIFSVGAEVFRLNINTLSICMNNKCYLKSSFVNNSLSKHYPADILKNIITSQDIFGGLNKQIGDSKISQKIKNENVDIVYIRENGRIYFKDFKNNILIIIQI